MSKLFPQIDNPELFFGFVSPIGTPNEETIVAFKKFFEANRYRVIEVKVTDVFPRLVKYVPSDPANPLDRTTYLKRIDSHIAYGNLVRSHFDDDSLLAGLAIQQIVEKRSSTIGRGERSGNVYLIHQFKRPEEITLLRSVYGRLFFQISIYSDRSDRLDYMCQRISRDEFMSDTKKFEPSAIELIHKDENEASELHGQRVGRIFHDADLILKLGANSDPLNMQVQRFCELIFSSNSVTPYQIEHGMYVATSAALRTSDLSRQVGAAIFSANGSIVSLGCNEVPKAGGGTYWPEDMRFDNREFIRGEDSNDVRKAQILNELLDILQISRGSLSKPQSEKIANASFMGALEYGRIVHAEMAAITEAARNQGALQDSVMYCTTFPCHMCAKHIVASGIKHVYFLEPYPKSLAETLHSDSIEVERRDRGQFKDFRSVKFTHFYGITPRRYSELFRRTKRKASDGTFQQYQDGRKQPYIDIKFPFYHDLEIAVLKYINDTVENES